MTVRTGIDVLQQDNFTLLSGKRVGLMTNPSAVDANLTSTYDLLAQAPTVNLTALYSPEHGFVGAAPDAEKIASSTDPRTGLPIHSLYGATVRPTPDMLADVDVLVCDIQDIGARFYTFVWTISHILEVAGEQGVAVMILDRPNPVGGHIWGPTLDDGLSSFVGRFPIPVIHGMTLGELCRMVNDRWNPTAAKLAVVPCEGWSRNMKWPETGLQWIAPSPNIAHYSTTVHYPGGGLIEGANLSEGRGTPLPFQVVGAPFIDARELAHHLNAQGWDGARFRAHSFLPMTSKWAGEYCSGVQVHITEPDAYRPIETWLGVIHTIRHLYPGKFEWLPPFTDGIEDGSDYHFDRLIGSKAMRAGIDEGTPLADLTTGWANVARDFEQQRQPYLLYGAN